MSLQDRGGCRQGTDYWRLSDRKKCKNPFLCNKELGPQMSCSLPRGEQYKQPDRSTHLWMTLGHAATILTISPNTMHINLCCWRYCSCSKHGPCKKSPAAAIMRRNQEAARKARRLGKGAKVNEVFGDAMAQEYENRKYHYKAGRAGTAHRQGTTGQGPEPYLYTLFPKPKGPLRPPPRHPIGARLAAIAPMPMVVNVGSVPKHAKKGKPVAVAGSRYGSIYSGNGRKSGRKSSPTLGNFF